MVREAAVAPAFLLQPHDLHPMSQVEFDKWVAILRANFPDHRRLAGLGHNFFPCTPEQAAVARSAWERQHPVCEMRDRDGARRVDPGIHDAAVWLDMIKPGDSLSLLRRDGGVLEIRGPVRGTFSLRCVDERGKVVLDAADLDSGAVLGAVDQYLVAT